jgi:hypothetical protein
MTDLRNLAARFKAHKCWRAGDGQEYWLDYGDQLIYEALLALAEWHEALLDLAERLESEAEQLTGGVIPLPIPDSVLERLGDDAPRLDVDALEREIQSAQCVD